MSDCAIKLFGKRIPLQSFGEEERDDDQKANSTNSASQDEKLRKDPSNLLQSENPKPSISPNEEESNTTSNNSTDKNDKSPPKKPDKILPCPRCNSTDTKFCYYNNYNVNQPRHFCKNCQRYWTAGGSMRNVPVGAGRRKSKSNFAALNGSHFYPNMPVNPLLQSSAINSKSNNSMVLNFGADSNPHPIGDDNSSISSLEGSKCKDEEKTKSSLEVSNDMNGTASLPYMWGPVPVPAMYNGSDFGVQLYPYWGCVPVPWNNGGWTVPWCNSVCTGSGTLGKHARDEIAPNCGEGERNNNIWVPKTLRIDNPEEAAKSSIWTMVGVHNEKSEKFGGKIAKMFEGKGEIRENNGFKSSALLLSNPAALARSANFRENA